MYVGLFVAVVFITIETNKDFTVQIKQHFLFFNSLFFLF